MATQKPKKQEIIDGFTVKYHANGVTRWSKGKVVDGHTDGYWEWYRTDGTLKRSGYFKWVSQLVSGRPMIVMANRIKLLKDRHCRHYKTI